ncbi:MAG: hypothetical protein QM426_08435 [Euryarchaeota archaeon]|nr:hypothetical protein [Euryarchaeota archaeon]
MYYFKFGIKKNYEKLKVDVLKEGLILSMKFFAPLYSTANTFSGRSQVIITISGELVVIF